MKECANIGALLIDEVRKEKGEEEMMRNQVIRTVFMLEGFYL